MSTIKRVVVGCSQNYNSVWGVDFTNGNASFEISSNDLGLSPTPKVVAMDGYYVVVGDMFGSADSYQVRLVDLRDPAHPHVRGGAELPFVGIGSIAIAGRRVAVGGFSSPNITLLDFTDLDHPVPLASATVPYPAGITSIGFVTSNVLVATAGWTNATLGHALTKVDFTDLNHHRVETRYPGIGSMVVNANPRLMGIVAAGASGTVKLFDVSLIERKEANLNASGVKSIAFSESGIALAGFTSLGIVKWIDFRVGDPQATPVVGDHNPQAGLSFMTAMDSVSATGAVAPYNSGLVEILCWSLQPTSTTLLGSEQTGAYIGVSSLAVGEFLSSPPGTPSIYSIPSSLQFGQVQTGMSETRQLTIGNSGASELTINAIDITSGAFTLVNPPPGGLMLQQNESANLTVQFLPTAVGLIHGSLTMHTNDPSNQRFEVVLGGTGATSARISVSPTLLDFGEVPAYGAGHRVRHLQFTITNSGSYDLIIPAWKIEGDNVFKVPWPQLYFNENLVIKPKMRHAITVTFIPRTLGALYRATLLITSNDTFQPKMFVELRGVGGLPLFSLFMQLMRAFLSR